MYREARTGQSGGEEKLSLAVFCSDHEYTLQPTKITEKSECFSSVEVESGTSECSLHNLSPG